MTDHWDPRNDRGPDDAQHDDHAEYDEYDEYDAAYEDDAEWIDYREPSGGGRRVGLALGAIAVAVLLIIGVAYVTIQGKIDPSGDPGADVAVVIESGSSTNTIGQVLEDQGVISSASIWGYWTKFKSVGPFQAGSFVFQENSSFEEAVAVLDAGPLAPVNTRVTIPEGFTVSEIVARLSDPEKGISRWSAEALQAAIDGGTIRSNFQPRDGTSMEGLLFPDTYDVDEDVTEEAFIGQLVAQLDATAAEFDIEARSAALGITPYEALIVASLIEEEARVDGDRARIAEVIYNRLADGMTLGIDATSRYEAELQGLDRSAIDFDSDSPYNTRRSPGLPPTPIAAPGRASIEAALNPTEGDLLYYVLADADGNHTFTNNYDDFLDAKAECARLGLGCG